MIRILTLLAVGLLSGSASAVSMSNLDLDTGTAATIHIDIDDNDNVVVPVPGFTSGAALMFSLQADGSGVLAPTGASGLGGTMTAIIDGLHSSGRRGAIFAYEGASNAGGNVTITFAANVSAVTVIVEQVTGAAAASTWGGSGREGFNTGTGSGVGRPLLQLSGALSTPAAGSATFAFGCITDGSTATTPEAGYTLLGDGHRSPFSMRCATAYHPSGDASPTSEMGQNASSDAWVFFGVEIPQAAGNSNAPRAMHYMNQRANQ